MVIFNFTLSCNLSISRELESRNWEEKENYIIKSDPTNRRFNRGKVNDVEDSASETVNCDRRAKRRTTTSVDGFTDGLTRL